MIAGRPARGGSARQAHCGWLADERGAALALALLWLPACLLAAALAVDGAWLLLARERAHHAADLGALAGAQELDLVSLRAGRVRLLPGRARDAARRFALANWRAAGGGTGVAAVDVRPDADRRSGRLPIGPTVEVEFRGPVHLSLAGRAFPTPEVRVAARASVVEKRQRPAGKAGAARESRTKRPRRSGSLAANTG